MQEDLQRNMVWHPDTFKTKISNSKNKISRFKAWELSLPFEKKHVYNLPKKSSKYLRVNVKLCQGPISRSSDPSRVSRFYRIWNTLLQPSCHRFVRSIFSYDLYNRKLPCYPTQLARDWILTADGRCFQKYWAPRKCETYLISLS